MTPNFILKRDGFVFPKSQTFRNASFQERKRESFNSILIDPSLIVLMPIERNKFKIGKRKYFKKNDV